MRTVEFPQVLNNWKPKALTLSAFAQSAFRPWVSNERPTADIWSI